jgi:hypothetical protein
VVASQAFSRTGAAKGQHAEAKRAAAVGIGNVMLAIYFRLNTLTNCKQVGGCIGFVEP